MSETQEELENRAKAVGWNPEGEKSAKEFLDFRDNHNGVLRENVKRLEGQLSHAVKTVDQMAAAWNKGIEKAHKDGIEEGIRSAKAEMRQAAKDGDDDAYEAAEKKLDAYEAEKDKKVEPAIDTSGNSEAEQLKETIVSHIQNNKELFQSSEHAEYWQKEMKHSVQVLGKDLEDAITIADKAVIKKFDLGKDIGGPDSGDKGGSNNSTGAYKSYNDLPAEGKAAFDAIKAKNPDYDIKEYLELVNE